jgi:hypothetical protein
MQLKRRHRRKAAKEDINVSLAAATCMLLGTAAPGAVVAQEIGQWDINAAGLYYGEVDRVRDWSVSVLARSQPLEDKYLNLTFTFDTLTGASPNGAAPSASPQLFARPITLTRTSGGSVATGGGAFIVPAGDLPLDSSFKDTRYAGAAHWQQPLGRLTTLNFGGSLSTEHDYSHTGLDAQLSHDFNNRNTTLSGGLAWSNDTVKPIGGSPLPFSELHVSEIPGGVVQQGPSSQGKHVRDLLLGVTQVLNRRTLVQVNFTETRSEGYLTDPYKIMSVVDPVTGDLVAGPDAGYGLYLYENRPDTRDQRSLYGLLKHDFSGNVLDASYRVMTDDWGVKSNTLDLHMRWDLPGDKFLQPHLRFYSQSAADFYHTVLLNGDPLPAYASADSRLSKLNAVTVGVKFGTKTSSGLFSARFEVYRQTGQPSPDALVGSLRTVDLNPDLTALVAELSYKFGW